MASPRPPDARLMDWLDGEHGESSCMVLSSFEAALCRAWCKMRLSRVIASLIEKWPAFAVVPFSKCVRLECSHPPSNQEYMLRLVVVPLNEATHADFRNHGSITLDFNTNEGFTEEVEESLTIRVECQKVNEFVLKKRVLVLSGEKSKKMYVKHLRAFLEYVGFPLDTFFPFLLECVSPLRALPFSLSPTFLHHSVYFTQAELLPPSAKVARALWDLAVALGDQHGGLHSLNLQAVEAPSSDDEEVGANLEDGSEGDESSEAESIGSLADFIDDGTVVDGNEGDEGEATPPHALNELEEEQQGYQAQAFSENENEGEEKAPDSEGEQEVQCNESSVLSKRSRRSNQMLFDEEEIQEQTLRDDSQEIKAQPRKKRKKHRLPETNTTSPEGFASLEDANSERSNISLGNSPDRKSGKECKHQRQAEQSEAAIALSQSSEIKGEGQREETPEASDPSYLFSSAHFVSSKRLLSLFEEDLELDASGAGMCGGFVSRESGSSKGYDCTSSSHSGSCSSTTVIADSVTEETKPKKKKKQKNKIRSPPEPEQVAAQRAVAMENSLPLVGANGDIADAEKLSKKKKKKKKTKKSLEH